VSLSSTSVANIAFQDIQAAASNLIASNIANTLRPSAPFNWDEPKQLTNEDRAASIENLIADFLPDSHKDLPVEIAKAVVEALFPYKEEAASDPGPSPIHNTVKLNTYGNTVFVHPNTFEDLKRYYNSGTVTTTSTTFGVNQ